MERNNMVRIFAILLIVSATLLILILKQNREKVVFNCPGDQIDLNQMLQYGDIINDFRITDKYGKLFDISNFSNEPILVLLIKNYTKSLKVYDDSLHKYLEDYFNLDLHLIYICSECKENPKDKLKLNGTIYCDNDSQSIFAAFKTFGHASCVIISKDHKMVLSTVSLMAPVELAKIIKYKKNSIF